MFLPKGFMYFSVTFFSLFRNERKKSNQKKESANGCRTQKLLMLVEYSRISSLFAQKSYKKIKK